MIATALERRKRSHRRTSRPQDASDGSPNWTTATLGSLSDFITKGSTPTTYGFRWQHSGVLFLRSECVSAKGLKLDQSMFISKDANAFFRRSQVADGDILITITGNVGRVVHLFGVGVANINQHIARIRIVSPWANSSFIYHFLSQSNVRSHYEEITTGQAYPQISLKQVRETIVPLPELKEQMTIANALDETDNLIVSIERLIEKKRLIKQGAMQELLTGQTRLHGFATKTQYKTEIGTYPDDWDVSTIHDIADVKTGPFGSALHESDYVHNGTPIITVEHLGNRGISYQNLPLVSDEDCARLSGYKLREGDIVFSRVGSVDRNAYVSDQETGWLFSGRLLRVRPRQTDVDPRYLSYHFHSESFKQRVRTVAVGQTMPSLNTRLLNNVLVVLPPREEQRAIANVLSALDAELVSLDARLEKARQIKQGMMQDLLTGEIRLA